MTLVLFAKVHTFIQLMVPLFATVIQKCENLPLSLVVTVTLPYGCEKYLSLTPVILVAHLAASSPTLKLAPTAPYPNPPPTSSTLGPVDPVACK